ncbi:MAG TPA: hypothetical protein VFR34_16285 [Paracoccaceae bacterium]|nr:hypothetical protein [Paracoccaceae bacterium]
MKLVSVWLAGGGAAFGPMLIAALWAAAAGGAAAQSELPNACPVDGCMVQIVGVEKAGDELALKFEANFAPDISKNHIHVWWGDNFRIEQVSNNAETVHNVKQGEWHPTADYPDYVTQSAASTSLRGNSGTICVSAADRNHDILDVKVQHCVDVSGLF